MVSGNLKMPLDKIRAVLNAAAVGIYRVSYYSWGFNNSCK
mgnify:FL=1